MFELGEGEIITAIDRITSSENIYMAQVRTENKGRGWLPIEAISIKDSVPLPESITNKMWIHSYYLDVLQSNNNETLFIYEPFWRDHFDKYKRDFYMGDKDYSWYEIASISVLLFTNIHNRIFEYSGNRFEFINSKNERIDNSYNFFSNCFNIFKEFNESDLENYFSENESVKFSLIPDGDYLDVYVNNNKFFTLVERTDEISDQFGQLMRWGINHDLTRITWPRRADGTMDYPPPVDISSYRETHTTTTRLRLRDNPHTSSLIVTTLNSGIEVQVLETGAIATIDGITAPWVRVLSSNSFTGWCFSGFLEEIYTPAITQKDFSEIPFEDNFILQEKSISEDKKRTILLLCLIIGAGVLTGGVAVLLEVSRKKE
jgi:hypothetical protein